MSTYDLITQNFDELYHHGIKGQKWGVRRFQNPDGSLTPEGKRRYGSVENFNRLSAAKSKMQKAKIAKQNANANYDSEYDKARSVKNSYGALIGSKTTKQKAAGQWEKTIDSAQKANKADAAYKQAKSNYKQIKKSIKKSANVSYKKLQKKQVDKGKEKVLAAKVVMKKARVDKLKADMQYDAAYDKARSVKNSYGALIGTKATKQEAAGQWAKTMYYGDKARRADIAYKQARKAYKQTKKQQKNNT